MKRFTAGVERGRGGKSHERVHCAHEHTHESEAWCRHGRDVRNAGRGLQDGRLCVTGGQYVQYHTINAVLEAAATYKSDVIIQLSNGGAQFYAGRGFPDGDRARILGAVSAARHVHMMAEHYGICVILHTDHASKKFIPWVEGMLDYGEAFFSETGTPLFSSHMLDLSEEPLAFNLDTCARTLERMAPLGMALEIELGITGGEEDGIGGAFDDSVDNSRLYTQPEEVLQAYETLAPIGMFAVAASFGNVHGVYQPGNVQLRPEILKHSQALVQERHQTGHNPLNLVFHGGSGSEKAKIAEALRYGVFKMNIDTDTQFAFAHPIGQYVSSIQKPSSTSSIRRTVRPTKTSTTHVRGCGRPNWA